MKAIIVALYPFRAKGQDAWTDHGSGMTYMAAKEAGCDVDFLDMKSLFNYHQLKDALTGYDLVAFGLKSSCWDLSQDVIRIAKEVGAKVMVAGVHTAAAPDELREDERIDYIFFGESEITFPDFLKNPNNYGREIIGEKPQNLDELPFIDRDIYREPLEDAMGWCGCDTMTTVIAARGCPFNCRFCQPVSDRHFGKKLRRRSVDSLIAELEILKDRYDPDFLMIHDDTFLLQTAWLEEFIEKYPKIGLPFWGSGRASGITKHPDLFKRLVKVGWSLVSVGFESGSQRMLDMLNKQTTVEQNLEAARLIREAGAQIYGNYILGFPGETKEEALSTIKMAEDINADLGSWAFFSPYPGNELGEECIAKGISLIGKKQYNRFPLEPKIKGVDYDFLNEALKAHRA